MPKQFSGRRRFGRLRLIWSSKIFECTRLMNFLAVVVAVVKVVVVAVVVAIFVVDRRRHCCHWVVPSSVLVLSN